MLPDDMENLAQSVIATNFFSNNILQAITTKDYWAVANEYKPLMHTWYLGVIGQFYLLYPFFFMIIMRKRSASLLPILSVFGGASLALYLLPYFTEYEKFYLLFFRFWELAAGGMAAVALKGKLIEHKYSVLLVGLLLCALCLDFLFIPGKFYLMVTVLLTVGILATANENKLHKLLLENRILVAIGKISFGLYLWHQVLLAYARYFWVQKINIPNLFIIYVLTIALTLFSYFFIEKSFSNKNKISTRALLLATGFVLALTTLSSFYIYLHAGVLKDIPELGIHKSEVARNIHARYNDRVYGYDKNFSSTNRLKVLVIGNSFARDWVNVLLESPYSDKIEISYLFSEKTGISTTYGTKSHQDIKCRVKEADFVFYLDPEPDEVRKLGIPETKLWAIGTKKFGTNIGIFYNYKGDGYYKQRTPVPKEFLEENDRMKKTWGKKYIDFLGKVIDENQTVPVFTPSNKFISQDTLHFTKAGAQYFAHLFEKDLEHIFANGNK